MNISVFMIVQNEEKNLTRALESVRWADEIVIVDGGSSDGTLGIAKRFTDKVHTRVFTDYAEQKNFAMSKASGDWLLSLDADEELRLESKEEIRRLLSESPRHAAYRIRRRSKIFGRWFRFTGTQDDRPVRLFRRGKARFVQPIHEKVEVDGSIGTLDSTMNHHTYPSAADYVLRFNDYTSREAALLSEKRARSGFLELNVKPILLFFKLYIWKQGFRDGEEGLIFSWLSAAYAFTKHAKHREREKTCVR